MKILIIIPAYNEALVIAETLISLRQELKRSNISSDLVLVDDGSTDNTALISSSYVDYILTHRYNCGLGAALATGIEFAKRQKYDACVTFDADGQHDPSDIKKALAKIDGGYDLVIGSRFLGSHSGMPPMRRLILLLGDVITFLFFGVWTSDSQSGFRALSRRAIEGLSLKSNRMEVSSEFFGEVRRLGLKYSEIPIHIRYTKYSLSKGQKNTGSLAVLLKLLYKVFT